MDSIRRQIGGQGLLVVVSWRVHGADEAQTLAGDGPDQLLLPAIVADRGSRRIVVSVDSDTIRPPQTGAIRSSLLTARSRFVPGRPKGRTPEVRHGQHALRATIRAVQGLISQPRKLSVIPGPGHPAGPILATATDKA